MAPDYDIVIIGGGINGAGIARDAAGRGLRVLLCEQDDLASHTSSASTKLIHGGLRYLEHYEFGLVRKALQERDVLFKIAPHIVRPLRFIMPYAPHLRPAWLIRLGLLLYDHLYLSEFFPKSCSLNLADFPVKEKFRKGFMYSDAGVQDARLVVLNARDAADRGATILTRTKFLAGEYRNQRWHCSLTHRNVTARFLVNAAGPWVCELLHTLQIPTPHTLRLVKGSHIITRRLFDHPQAYLLQQPDKRIVFVIPYENHFTLIGTTEVDFQGDPSTVTISREEILYLCEAVNRYLTTEITPRDVLTTYSGVRPLLSEAKPHPREVTRDYRLEWNRENALLSVFGGKITTYRKLAEAVLEKLGFSHGTWTASTPLPGGDMDPRFIQEFKTTYAWLPCAERYLYSYGTRAKIIINGAKNIRDLGKDLGHGLYEAEIHYLKEYEWAQTMDDILWRRTTLGLHDAYLSTRSGHHEFTSHHL